MVTCPQSIRVIDDNGKQIRHIDCAPALGGFEFELLTCKKALQEGKIECAEWTHAESIAVGEIVDKVLELAKNINPVWIM